jgi:hypothetical protein
MICPVIHDARIEKYETTMQSGTVRVSWNVMHPSNGAVLAYCDTEDEAKDYRDAINDLPRQLRAVGHKVT